MKYVTEFINGYILLFILILLTCKQAAAENVKEYTKIWTSAQIAGSITRDKKWNYYLEPQLRFTDDKYKFNELNLYAGLYYQTTSALSLWMGIYRQYQKNSDGSSSQQYRLWEQMVWHVIDNTTIKLISRSRFEESKNFIYSQIANRFRQKLTLKVSISPLRNYYLVMADEVFLQLNQPAWLSTNRVFSQNRASIGVQFPINKRSSYEVGYLNQFQYENPNKMSNILYLNLNMHD